MRCFSIVCVLILATASHAGPLANLRARLQSRQPTQVIAQTQTTTTTRTERSVLKSRQRAPAGAYTPTSAQPASPQAPKAPKEAPATAPKTKAKSASLSSDETRMVTAINQYRANRSLPPLTADPLLERIARSRVSVFNHNHPRFGWVWQHAHRLGFPGPALNTTCTDDLAKGDLSPEDAVQGWADSSVGHAEQMRGLAKMNGRWENCHFNLCGVARQGNQYIAVFGRRDDCGCMSGQPCTCGGDCQCGK